MAAAEMLKTVDLHGCTVAEAVSNTRRVLEQMRETSLALMAIGRGSHSADHRAHIRQQVIKLLKSAEYSKYFRCVFLYENLQSLRK